MPKKSKKPIKESKNQSFENRLAKKPVKATGTVASSSEPRRIKESKPRLFSFKKHYKVPKQPLPSAYKIFWNSLKILISKWEVFSVIALIYIALDLIFVRGFSSGVNLSSTKQTLSNVFKGSFGGLKAGATLFVYLVGGSASSSTSSSSGVYDTFLIIMISLATIWALRQLYNDNSPYIRARDAFYKGMQPLIGFILIIILMSIELIPLLIGGFLYSTVVNNAIAVNGFEKLLWGLLFLVLAAVSIYMICSSAFALYIVTLPDMTPMKALRSARQLVRGRRLSIIVKLLFLFVALLVIGVVILLPLLLLITSVAVWVYFVLTMLSLIVVHSYMYALYRELLK